MKIIEALKQIKDLQKKAEDLKAKVAKHSAYLSYETPMYQDQKKQVSEWIQVHSDVLKEILHLRVSIQKTNLETNVTMILGGKSITKSIAEWIHRRRDLASSECKMWQQLTDRGLREGKVTQSTGETMEVKIARCYDPVERDNNTDLYINEPSIIDARLEIVNAVTDLVELSR